jgi:hypothetical protein
MVKDGKREVKDFCPDAERTWHQPDPQSREVDFRAFTSG